MGGFSIAGRTIFSVEECIKVDKGDDAMPTAQVQVPMEIVGYGMIIPITILVLCMVFDWYYCIVTRKRGNGVSILGFSMWLNFFRATFYPLAIINIYMGLRTGAIVYPHGFDKYTLVPAEYTVTIPLLAFEGLAGLHSFVNEFILGVLSKR